MKIYALMSGQLVLYVGKTVQTLKDRALRHNSISNATTSKYIPDWIDWEIKLLEEVPDDQATAKEQHYYDTLKPLYNKQRPGQTKSEYFASGQWKELSKKIQSTRKTKEYRKQYRASDDVKERRGELRRARYASDEIYREACKERTRLAREAKKATQSQ
jgi:hypothetical protein